MKRIFISVMAFSVLSVMAQEKAVQSGTPAKLEAINGKQISVFLQSQKEGELTFQPRKSTRNVSVGIEKVSKLTFFIKYDAAAVEASFNEGDYPAVVKTLEPLLEPLWDYMVIENNLRHVFRILMDSNRKLGEYTKVRKAAAIFLASGDEELIQRAQVNLALSALAENDRKTADKIRKEVSSEAARLYLQACIERADNQPKKAIRTVAKIITNHANDIVWLAPSELLCAYLYLDMMGSDSIITTNSALHTARQVKSIYSGTHVAADATTLWASLGGEAIEAAKAAEKLERIAQEKKKKEKRKAEKKAQMEEKAKALAETLTQTNMTDTVEM